MGEYPAREFRTCNGFSILTLIAMAGQYYSFSRSMKGNSDEQDLDLSSNHYILLGIGDTPQGSILYVD